MGRLREIKDFVDEVFTPSEGIEEPHRSRMQKWMNVAKRTGGTMLGATVALFVADPVLMATGHSEIMSDINEAIPYVLGTGAAAYLGCVARIGMIERENYQGLPER